MERYQNGMLVFRTEKETSELPFVYSGDEKKLSIEALVEQNDSFIEQIYLENQEEVSSKEELLNKILWEKEDIISLPFYSVKNQKVVYIPHVLSCHLCGTNGMCAGNSPEEAIIEGISEILERYVSAQLIYRRTALPEIPDWYLEKFPKVQEMYSKLKSKKGYICKLLDCSLGGKYPVAGLVIMQKNTGRFGFKLGAHPDYGIAMERCFTEAAQGMDILEYAQGCLFDFKNEDIDKEENIREFIYSTVATIPYQVFSPEKTYQFTQIADISTLDNKEILHKLEKDLLEEGHDILVRDVSSLGFPSFRIIIPGMTEIEHCKMASRFYEFEQLEHLLKNLNTIRLDNIEEIVKLMEIQVNEVGFDSLSMFISLKDTTPLVGEEIGVGAKYFLAMCYLVKGDYEKAEQTLEDILFIATNCIPQSTTTTLIRAVYYYASAMNKLKQHNKVMYYIKLLFDEEISNKIENSFKDRENILINHYEITQEDYVENDDVYYLPFMETLRKAQKENAINQNEMKKLFLNKAYKAHVRGIKCILCPKRAQSCKGMGFFF